MIIPAPLHNSFMSLSVLSLCLSLAACGGSDTPEDVAAAPTSAQTLETPAAMRVARISVAPGVAGTNKDATGSAPQPSAGPGTLRFIPVASAPEHFPASTDTLPSGAPDSTISPEAADESPASRSTSPTFAPPARGGPPIPSGTVLDGSGVPGTYAPGCMPTLYSDFIDTLTWNVRHVEPRDCAILKVSTPVFAWKQPFDGDLSVPYTFELRNAAGGLVASKVTSTPRLLLTDTTLTPGNYTWTVSYRNKSGKTNKSASRRFNVSSASAGVTIPSGASIVELARSKPHPRALPSGASFSAIADAALDGEYNASFNAFMKAAATFRAETPPTPPADLTRADFASDLEYNNWTQQLARAAEREHKAIETLGYAAKFSGDTAYALAGVTRLVNLAAWPTRGATSEAVQDQANREIYVALAIGLDIFDGRLTSPQALAVALALKDRVQQAYQKLASLDASPYQSHLLNSVKYIVTALSYAVGATGFAEAQDWLPKAWETWITTESTWGADGGFANSTAYGWWAGISLAETAATMRLITNTDLSRWPAVGRFGDNMLAFVAPSISLGSPFGDSAETNWLYEGNSWNAYRLYAAVTRSPDYEWYWRMTPSNINKPEALTALHYLMLGLKLPPVTPAAPAAKSWVFEDAGLVAMHSLTADPYRSSLYFRSSRFGSYSHSTADNNGFVFVSKGQPLFISGGYYPYYMSPHHALVGRATRFKNALTIDGGIGQAEPSPIPTAPGKPISSMDARGQLINFHDSGTWAVTSGDAAMAYRGYEAATGKWTPLLDNAVRTVAYNRTEKLAVIYDWATSSKARTWELNFQMLNAPVIQGSTLRAVAGNAQGCVDVYNAPGAFKVTKGFPIAPENGLPDEYQARYSVSRASTELVAVTVIREDCRSVPVNVTVNASSASVTVNGAAPLVMDRRAVTVP